MYEKILKLFTQASPKPRQRMPMYLISPGYEGYSTKE